VNKVVYVPAHFAPIYDKKRVDVPTGIYKKRMFSKEEVECTRSEEQVVKSGESDCLVDGQRLADDIAQAIASLNEQGYEVVTVIHTTSGAYDYKYGSGSNSGYGYGYGYSYTSGATIIAREILN